jgi:O-antigen ligase
VAHFAPNLGPSFVSRISASPSADANVQWRERTSAAVIAQISSAPITGVGFGKLSSISNTFYDPTTGLAYSQQQEIGQDPHNGYLYLLAGGGVLVLGPFLLLLSAYAWDLWRKLRSQLEPVERALLLWSSLSAFVILASAAAGTVFEGATDVLALWTLLMLPAAVKLRRPASGLERTVPA